MASVTCLAQYPLERGVLGLPHVFTPSDLPLCALLHPLAHLLGPLHKQDAFSTITKVFVHHGLGF